jgi:photosystem II stability/assembly factor-like uncharacterized protein
MHWQKTNGPVGGFIVSLRSFGDTLFAGAGEKGIIFYSANSGETWQSVYKTNHRVVDFEKTGDHGILASIGTNGIYKTLDNVYWNSVHHDNNYFLQLGKNHNNHIYIGTVNGKIYTSTDNGITWSLSFTHSEQIGNFAMYQDSTIFVGASKKILRRKITWETVYNHSINQFIEVFTAKNIVYAFTPNFIYKTEDGGDNWLQIDHLGFFEGNFIYDMVYNNRLIAACGDEINWFGNGWGIALSNNNGNSWYWSENIGLPPRFSTALKLIVSGSNTYLGTNAAGVFKSTNFGDSWFPVNNGLTAANTLDICFDNNGTLYSASWSNGFQKSTDKGNTWSVINDGLTNSYCYSIIADDNGNLIGGTDQGIFRSTDGGANWTQTSAAGNNFSYRLYKDNLNRIYSLNFDDGIFRTTNLGISWQRINSNFASSGVFGFAIDSSGNLYAGTRGGWIYKSSNGGTSWTVSRQGTGSFYGIVMLRVSSNGSVFAATNDQGILRSTDNGVTWENITNNITGNNARNLGINSRGEIFTSVNSNTGERLYFSDNNGQSWQNYTNNLNLISTYNIIFDENDNVYLATDESVWRSDGVVPVELNSFTANVNGNNVNLSWLTSTETNNKGFELYRKTEEGEWEQLSFIPGSGTTTEQKEYSYTDNDLASGTYNYKLVQIDYNGSKKTYNLADFVEIIPIYEFALHQNYPNPFNPTTTIKYSVKEAGTVTLKVYDILGKEITTLVNETKPPGEYTATFDASLLSSGIYFYTMQAGGFIATNKLLLLK